MKPSLVHFHPECTLIITGFFYPSVNWLTPLDFSYLFLFRKRIVYSNQAVNFLVRKQFKGGGIQEDFLTIIFNAKIAAEKKIR